MSTGQVQKLKSVWELNAEQSDNQPGFYAIVKVGPFKEIKDAKKYLDTMNELF